MSLNPLTHDRIDTRLPTFACRFQSGQHVSIKANGRRHLPGRFLRTPSATFLSQRRPHGGGSALADQDCIRPEGFNRCRIVRIIGSVGIRRGFRCIRGQRFPFRISAWKRFFGIDGFHEELLFAVKSRAVYRRSVPSVTHNFMPTLAMRPPCISRTTNSTDPSRTRSPTTG